MSKHALEILRKNFHLLNKTNAVITENLPQYNLILIYTLRNIAGAMVGLINKLTIIK